MEQECHRRGRPRDDELFIQRREQILSAAETLFAGQGFPATEMQQVADAIGSGKGTLYRYFPSKEDLFLATVDRAMHQLRESVQAACTAIADPLQKLKRGIQAYFEHFQNHPQHAELLIMERAEYRDRRTPTYLEHRRANACEWEAVYTELIKDGRVRQIPVQRILTVVSDLVYGTMFSNHFTGHLRTPEEQARDVIDIVFHGILTAEEQKRTMEGVFPLKRD